MRFVALSDTHGFHSKLQVPDGDVLLFAGDLGQRGVEAELLSFNRFLTGLPHRHKIVIAGNHDFCFEREPVRSRELLSAATYLCDEEVVIEGYKIYGAPWQPRFCDWAFNLPRGPKLAEKWSLIPEDTDILLTHGPPKGILDRTFDGRQVGCADLRERLRSLKVKVHLFGHIHESYGSTKSDGTTFLNASIWHHFLRKFNPPLVFDLP